ncbi:MAG: pyridoxine 5'-phosphate synthase [Candidatus Omnitrophica bacterium]|nr:pyridoxine 5'-phosphate synthase [Candidatus Omnitrophota bacterium]
MLKLGVNIDHLATLREARKITEPDPVKGALIAESAGADSIVAHLRQDRRHINEKDVKRLKEAVKTRLNLEMSVNPEIVEITKKIRPPQATLVPENRQEITTEGGLDVVSNFGQIKKVVDDLRRNDIIVSLFINPEPEQIEAAKKTGAEAIELHTGEYVNAKDKTERIRQLKKLKDSVLEGVSRGLTVNAGHGLNYDNVKDVVLIPELNELNIGHSIISEAVFTGLDKAVRQMKELIS